MKYLIGFQINFLDGDHTLYIWQKKTRSVVFFAHESIIGKKEVQYSAWQSTVVSKTYRETKHVNTNNISHAIITQGC